MKTTLARTVLAAAIPLTVLAACGSSDSPGAAATTAAAPASTAAATTAAATASTAGAATAAASTAAGPTAGASSAAPTTGGASATTASSSGSTAAGVARASTVTKMAVPYATTSPSQTLDLYLPASDGTKPVPVVVLIHGGAFRGGSSAMEASHAQALAAKGIASASVNYRLSGEAPFPAGAQDVKAAVRWLRANAATYGLDPNNIGAWGESAGGWMANMLGVSGDQSTVFDDPSLGNADQSSAVQAVVSWFGPTDFATMDAQANQTSCTNPDVHGTAGSPESVWLGEPVATSAKAQQTNLPALVSTAKVLPAWFLAHGTADCQVTPGQSAELKASLDAKGATATFNLLQGAKHGDPAFDQTQLTPSIEFLVKALTA